MSSAVSLECPRNLVTPVSQAPQQPPSIAPVALQTIRPLSKSLASHNLAALEQDAAFQELFSKELFRRLTPVEKSALRRDVERLGGWKPTRQELDAFKTCSVDPEKDWTAQAISCLMKGTLNEDQIARLFLYKSSASAGGNVYQLYGGKERDKELAYTLFEESMKFAELTTEELQQLYERVRQLPPEETQFYTLATPAMTKDEVMKTLRAEETIDIGNFFQGYFDFPLFSCKEEDEDGAVDLIQIVPSPRLFQEILRCKFGANAMKPVPVFGYFKKEKMSDPTRRTIGLPGLGTQPDKVHGIISSDRCGFIVHDLYHLYTESANVHRDIWVKLALDQQDQAFKVDLLDRHFPLYARKDLRDKLNLGREPTPQEIFWYSLRTSIDAPSFDNPRNMASLLHSVEKFETTPEFQAAGISIENLRTLWKNEPPNVPPSKSLTAFFPGG